ncbi:MAG TPA: translation initiation factor IF-3 [Candidatus Eisenbacteria bacterium]|nr:translation initiation factor IF-3 [Candidatus Eisenbacteria bacterium]
MSKNTTRINEYIRVPQVRLIDADGNQAGVVPTVDAIRMAKEAELDLVEVAGQAVPPVCRIMDFSKFKYDQAKKEKEARKKQKVIHLKEIKFHPFIEEHDYKVKFHNLERFLKQGDKAKITMVFRGREMNYVSTGRKLLERLSQEIAPLGEVEKAPYMEGKIITMIIMPK